MHRTMFFHPVELLIFQTTLYGIFRHIGLLEPLPHNLFRQLRRVCHIVSIETVVAQFVEENLVSWEVFCQPFLTQALYSQQQRRLAYLIPVCTVCQMPYGADGHHHSMPLFSKPPQKRPPYSNDLVDSQPCAFKERRRQLMAVAHHPPVVLEDVCGAKGKNQDRRPLYVVMHFMH